MKIFVEETALPRVESLGFPYTVSRAMVSKKDGVFGDIEQPAYEVDVELPESSVDVVAYFRRDGNAIVRNALNNELADCIPAQYRQNNFAFECDHCHANRDRTSVWLVRRKADGQWMTVGRNCLSDLVGSSFVKYLRLLEISETTNGKEFYNSDECREYGYGKSVHFDYVDGLSYLAHAVKVVRKNGFVSRGEAEYSRCYGDGPVRSTHSLVCEAVWEKPDDADVETARLAIAWYLLKPAKDGDELDANTRSVLSSIGNGFLRLKTLSRVTWVVNSYLKFLARTAAKEKRDAGVASLAGTEKFSAAVGEKVDVDVVFDGYSHFEGFYGTTFVWRFFLPGGVKGVWFTSKGPWIPKLDAYGDVGDVPLEAGDRIHVKGTVKEWGEYKGEPQVSFTRLSVSFPGFDKFGKPIAEKKSKARKRKAATEEDAEPCHAA